MVECQEGLTNQRACHHHLSGVSATICTSLSLPKFQDQLCQHHIEIEKIWGTDLLNFREIKFLVYHEQERKRQLTKDLELVLE